MRYTWKTKGGMDVTGKPATKIYYLLLRDRNGFEKKIKNRGFVDCWYIEDNHVARVEAESEMITMNSPHSGRKGFYFEEWLNNSVALYLEKS